MSKPHVFAHTPASCPKKVTAGGDRAAGWGDIGRLPQEYPRFWVPDSGSLCLHSGGPGCCQPLLHKDPSGRGAGCPTATMVPLFCLSREAGALVSGDTDTRAHRLGKEIRQEGQLCTRWLGGSEMCGSVAVRVGCPPQLRALSPFSGFVPQISLSSHLLLCSMPFRVWGIEPSCPALRGPHVGACPGEPAFKSPARPAPGETPGGLVLPSASVSGSDFYWAAQDGLSRALVAAVHASHMASLSCQSLALPPPALVSPAEPSCPWNRGVKACM